MDKMMIGKNKLRFVSFKWSTTLICTYHIVVSVHCSYNTTLNSFYSSDNIC